MKKFLVLIITLCIFITNVKAIDTTNTVTTGDVNTNNTVTTNNQVTNEGSTTTDTPEVISTNETTEDIQEPEKIDAIDEELNGNRIVINTKKVVIFVGAIIALYILFLIIRKPKDGMQTTFKEIKDSALNKFIPDIKLSELEDNLANQYIEYLELYKEKDLDKIKIITNSILFEKTRIEIEKLNTDNQSKFFDDYTIKERGITSIKLENKRLVSELYLDIEYVDYTKDTIEDKIIEGNQYYREHYIFTLKYYLSKEGKSKLIEINRIKKI